MGREQDSRPRGRRISYEAIDEVTAVGVEPGVGFVEQPQPRPSTHDNGESGSPTLTGGQPADGNSPKPTGQAETTERRFEVGIECPIRPCPEADVLLDREFAVERRMMGEQSNLSTNLVAARTGAEVVTKDVASALTQREQAGTQPQKGGLSRSVRPLQQDHLTRAKLEVRAGQSGKAPEKADGIAQPNHPMGSNSGRLGRGVGLGHQGATIGRTGPIP